MTKILRFIAAAILAAFAIGASAQTFVTAQVTSVEMNTYSSSSVWNLRAVLVGTPVFCSAGTNSTWAYLNLGEPGYDDYSSLLKYSKGSGLTATIYTEPVTTSGTTACHIRSVKLN